MCKKVCYIPKRDYISRTFILFIFFAMENIFVMGKYKFEQISVVT